MKTLAAALLCLFPLFAAADAPDLKVVETWLEETPRAREYRGGKERILGVFRDAGGRDIPLELLFDKLKEGTSKRIPPEDLIARLAEEGFRLYMAREAVHASGLVPAGTGVRAALLRNASLALLSGLSEGTLYAVLSAAKESGKGPEGAGEFLSAFVRMHAVASFSPEYAGSLSAALFSGNVPVRSYGSLVSLFLRASAGRIPPDVCVRIMTDVLGSGGGIVQIDRELSRRIKSP